MINYLDLFSGIGGFHLGLQNAGFKFDWTGHSEIDKYAEKIYHKHFSESECLGDVRTIRSDTLPKLNLVTFGFPCQDISIAGKRGGLRASRSGLFFEAMRIIAESKPDVFIFENVKGLFSSSEGRDFEVILRTIADIGLYDCEWQLLNTRWVLPQNRERIFFAGHLRGRSQPKVFPIGESDGKSYEKSKDILSAIDANYYKGKSRGFGGQGRQLIQIGHIGCNSMGQRVYSSEGIATSIRGEGGGQGRETGLYYTINYDQKINSVRRLTPVECARLQGFPDDWCKELSDTQAYKCYGNAVTVPIVGMITRKLIKEKE